MKYIYILVLFLAVVSCSNKNKLEKNYLRIKNNTSYEVIMAFVNRADTFQFKEFVIAPKKTIFADTIIIEYDCTRSCVPINGSSVESPYWLNFNSSAIIYDFEGVKISSLQLIHYNNCDSTDVLPCNYITIDSFINEKDNLIVYDIIKTFHITKQQYNLADSL